MTFNIEEQLAGWAAVEFFLLEETSAWPVVVTDENAGTIVLTPEVNDVDGTIEPDSIIISDDPKDDASGQLWPIDIRYRFLARNAAMEQLLEQYANKPGIVRGCGNDGNRKQWGTNQEPVYMTYKNAYGTKRQDAHGIDITIKGDLSSRPVYFSMQT
jgi:hypothetical protein